MTKRIEISILVEDMSKNKPKVAVSGARRFGIAYLFETRARRVSQPKQSEHPSRREREFGISAFVEEESKEEVLEE
ncbi:MAG: hypothetical protein A2836_01095 [Candidatus Taylorbacteria bacterium RIFCSPHIGHO2_01_FULL_45_63]|uniref:Uncharacterized protein n=1 Tax=Candidatus Taylorbacteria bacterium RIFCSPHIGHO2_02_FULL_45_35 TaxID=1802311 RepID=A0A1G2MWK3_9BACT|nr:MAG: hypothetical protein A2836_01095 [Candidatus Taylorbacteria bacterium RIFCSPHIGHO2_01_FULL_45_63]OHA27559.1 MAG: hypothetical protein A3D56_02820 [Candidatus Taylorbacteria bacterium RIFCSPHIGHO2_02_FULL_45_35]